MGKKKTKIGNTKLLGIALIVLLGLLGIYLLRNNNTASNSTTTSAQSTLSSLQRTISTTAPIIETKSIDWIDANNQVVPLKGYRFGIGTFANNYMGKYGNFSDISEITETSLQPLQSTGENFFVKNGFNLSRANDKKNSLATNYGYELNDVKCLIGLSPQSDPFGSFFCGTVDEQELAWRKELAPVINPKNDPNTMVSVSKLVGNYATGGVGGYAGGAAWYAVKVNGQWQEVWTGQNIISCKPVQQYKIPKEIYGHECSNNY